MLLLAYIKIKKYCDFSRIKTHVVRAGVRIRVRVGSREWGAETLAKAGAEELFAEHLPGLQKALDSIPRTS